jgi:hypothetical protein
MESWLEVDFRETKVIGKKCAYLTESWFEIDSTELKVAGKKHVEFRES